MEKPDQKSLETATKVLEILQKMEADYTQQALKMQDTQIIATLETMKMFQGNNTKKLENYLKPARG
jgi:hypothetical protein